MPAPAAELEIRIATACKLLMLLQDAVEKNGNHYSGSMVPNFTSVTDVLTAPFELVAREIPAIDRLHAQFLASWNSRAIIV